MFVRHGAATPDEVTILTKAVDDYCAIHRIWGGAERELIAERVRILFGEGFRDLADLAEGLERMAIGG